MSGGFAFLGTEQPNPRTARIDTARPEEILALIQREEARVPEAVRKVRPAVARGARLLERRMRSGGRILFVGAGTSGRLGVMEAAECPPTFDTPPELVQAIMAGGPDCVWASREGAEDDERDGARQVRRRGVRASDTVVGIAASGVTPFVQGALAEAARAGAGRILITCNRRGVPRGSADVVIAPEVGPEVIAGSTRLKAGTATKLVLNALTVTTMIRLGKVYGNLMVDLQPRSAKLRARAIRILTALTGAGGREAVRALRSAGNRVKTAVVMLRRGVGKKEADRLLARAAGRLRDVIG